MSRALFFHLRKAINTAMPGTFGAGKNLLPSHNFNNDGKITFAHGDFNELVEQLQKAIGPAYVVQHNMQQRSIVIMRVTDVR